MAAKRNNGLMNRILARVTSNLMTRQVTASLEGKLSKAQIKSELKKLAAKHNGTDAGLDITNLLNRM
jgi:hypothetical protein